MKHSQRPPYGESALSQAQLGVGVQLLFMPAALSFLKRGSTAAAVFQVRGWGGLWCPQHRNLHDSLSTRTLWKLLLH